MWQSFRAIGRGSSEHPWRNKKKHLGQNISPSGTDRSGRPNERTVLIVLRHRAVCAATVRCKTLLKIKATGSSRFQSQKFLPISVKIPKNSRYENTACTFCV